MRVARAAASRAHYRTRFPHGTDTTWDFLQGKRALITGIASQRSIANGIAEAMHREGAELAFTYQNEKLQDRASRTPPKEYGSDIVLPLDVADDAQIAACFDELGKRWDGFDILVHCDRLTRRAKRSKAQFLDGLTRENFASRTTSPRIRWPRWPRPRAR